MPSLLKYTLRQIDPELWDAVKKRAASEGRSIRFVLIELLQVYAKHGFAVVEKFKDGRRRKR